jgi:hypothetical protein
MAAGVAGIVFSVAASTGTMLVAGICSSVVTDTDSDTCGTVASKAATVSGDAAAASLAAAGASSGPTARHARAQVALASTVDTVSAIVRLLMVMSPVLDRRSPAARPTARQWVCATEHRLANS